jgi:hypothetical protein
VDPQQYVTDIQAKLIASTAVATITIIEERLLSDRGYFRARLTLSNNDFSKNSSPIFEQRKRISPISHSRQHLDGS